MTAFAYAVSQAGGSGITAGTTVITGGTTGSVLFVGAASVIQQDNANFFWDDTSNLLGLQTAAPTHTLTIGNGGKTSAFAVYNTADQVTNYERGVIAFTGNQFKMSTAIGGTGTARSIVLSGGTLTSAQFRAVASTGGNLSFDSGSDALSGGLGYGLAYTNTGSAGISQGLTLTYTLAQSGSAGYIGLNINCVQSSTGSGVKYICNFALGGLTKAYIDNAGQFVSSSTVMCQSSAALGNGAAAGAGTITNAPAAGNPTKWVPINDNGTTRYIPAW